MSKRKKKARPAGSTAGQAKRERHWASGNSHKHFSTGQGPISRYLLEGQENAIPRRELEKLTGLDGRTVRLMIERERRAGVLIISDNSTGYYLTCDPAEAQRFAHSMQHRAGEILKTARAIQQAANYSREVFNE